MNLEKTRRLGAVSVVALSLLGCATPYQKASLLNLSGGGYTDRQLEPGLYEIEFSGTPATPLATVEAYWHQRAKELCGSADYEHEAKAEQVSDGGGMAYAPGVGVIPTPPTHSPRAKGYARCKTMASVK